MGNIIPYKNPELIRRGCKFICRATIYQASDGKISSFPSIMVMVKSSDGFVIAEEDLLLRGAGEVLGTRQHGLPDLKIADSVHDIKILEQSKLLAAEILDIGLADPQYEALREKITQIYERKLLLQSEE